MRKGPFDTVLLFFPFFTSCDLFFIICYLFFPENPRKQVQLKKKDRNEKHDLPIPDHLPRLLEQVIQTQVRFSYKKKSTNVLIITIAHNLHELDSLQHTKITVGLPHQL